MTNPQHIRRGRRRLPHRPAPIRALCRLLFGAAFLAVAAGSAVAGFTTDMASNPKNKNPCSSCGCTGMCGYGINRHDVSLDLADTPVGYKPPKGPSAEVRISYDERDESQPANFNFFNVGPNWTLNWLSYVEDDPGAAGSNVTRYLRDGTLYSYSGFDGGTRDFAAQEDDGTVLRLTSRSPVVYEAFHNDGSIEVYQESDGAAVFPRRVFLSRIIDPQGNALDLDYGKTEGRVRLASLTDATGRKTTFAYGVESDPLRITKITDPFGRSALLGYDVKGRLASITDVLKLTSKFTYNASSEVVSLTTPYGTTHFASGGSGNRRFLNVVDPLGFGERVETMEPAPVPGSDPPATVPQGMTGLANEFLQYRDNFHWDQHQYAVAGCTPSGNCNYADAQLLHFTHDAADSSFEWDTIESRKEPLENRVWYTYPGQAAALFSGTYDLPNAIGRVLDSGQTQLTQIAYNSAGNPTELVDAAGRTTTLAYAVNEIDVAQIVQTTAAGPRTIAGFTYNGRHEPLTYKDAAGKTTRYAYNAAGERISQTDPLGEETKYVYDATGDLVRVIDANGKTAASLTYDLSDRVKTYTDAQGWTVAYDYDAANRPTRATYPDGTTEEYAYDRLDLVSFKDREGHLWRYVYDADRRLTARTDPLGHVTRYAYFENGVLKSLTDANGHRTSWDIDVESRPVAKHYADGTTTTYTYENTTSRLAEITDALGQVRNYQYTVDDRLAGLSYENTINPTPPVGFAYDPDFPRLTVMSDGSGTTDYSYVPVGSLGAMRLAREAGPLPNGTIDYAYDALGRVIERTVGGAGPETFRYDRIGRIAGHGDALGQFALAYLGETAQMTARVLAGTRLATAWSYLPNAGDRRLKSIVNSFGREFDYTITADGLVTAIAETKAGKKLRRWSLGYDADNRLTSAVAAPGGSDTYALDPVGNIVKSGKSSFVYNRVNEMANAGYVYDADGELLSDGVRRFAWDAEHRLVGVTQGDIRTSFAYDGRDRRVAMATTEDGKTTAADFIWCGARLCQSRSATGKPERLYYAEGEVLVAQAAKLYYGLDQLGSVRDMDVLSRTISAPGQEYDYDPYGNPIATPSGVPLTDFRYAGTFLPGNGSAEGGLGLTQYRAYDPRIARWLSRDPLGETAGVNLYTYAEDDPIAKLDPSGLLTLGLGGGGIGGIGPVFGWFAIGIVFDPCGHVGIFVTFGAGLGGGIEAQVGPVLDVTTAHSINDLTGPSLNAVGAFGPVAGNVSVSNYSNGQHYYGGYVTGGPGVGGYVGGGGGYTKVIPVYSPGG